MRTGEATYREYVVGAGFVSRGRKPPLPVGWWSSSRKRRASTDAALQAVVTGGVGPSAALRTLNDEHRITSAHDALHLDVTSAPLPGLE